MSAVAAKGSSAPDPEEEAALWRRWRHAGDEQARGELLQMHLPYARTVAAVYYNRRFNDEIEFGDYLQLASLGMVESMSRFDPSMGVGFRTFASRRMHGSIIDGIERSTEKQQQIAARSRLEAQRRESIRADTESPDSRAPSAHERTSEQLLAYVADAGLAFALGWLLEGTGMVEGDAASDHLPFYRSTELKELRERTVDLLKCLTPRERAVVRGHYFQDLPFEEIATRLAVTKGRVSQLHKRALERLRGAIRSGGTFDMSA